MLLVFSADAILLSIIYRQSVQSVGTVVVDWALRTNFHSTQVFRTFVVVVVVVLFLLLLLPDANIDIIVTHIVSSGSVSSSSTFQVFRDTNHL